MTDPVKIPPEDMNDESLNELDAQVVDVLQSATSSIHADMARLNQSAVGHLRAEHVDADLSLFNAVEAETVHLTRGAAVSVRGQLPAVGSSAIGVLAAESAELTNSASGVVVASTINTTGSRSLVTIAGAINGPVETVLDTRGALLAGLSAGVAIGLIFLVRALTRRN